MHNPTDFSSPPPQHAPLFLRAAIWLTAALSAPLFLPLLAGAILLGGPTNILVYSAGLVGGYALFALLKRYYAKPLAVVPRSLWLMVAGGVVANFSISVWLAFGFLYISPYSWYFPVALFWAMSPSFLLCLLVYKMNRYNRTYS